MDTEFAMVNLGPNHTATMLLNSLQFLAAKALICDLHEVQRLCPSLPRLAHSYSKRPDVSHVWRAACRSLLRMHDDALPATRAFRTNRHPCNDGGSYVPTSDALAAARDARLVPPRHSLSRREEQDAGTWLASEPLAASNLASRFAWPW